MGNFERGVGTLLALWTLLILFGYKQDSANDAAHLRSASDGR